MKTSIPSDVWEKKKGLIAKLYKEEEWPLKQVIKQIRTDDFNPSETQLRSRLKKWRVTKPSRQTRKKNQDGSQEFGVDEDEVEETSPEEPTVASTLPPQQPPTQASPESSTNLVEWYGPNGWGNPPQQPPPPPPPQSQQTNMIHQSVLSSSMSFGVQEPSHSWGSSSSPESLSSAHKTQNLTKQHPSSVATSVQPYSMVHPHASNNFDPQQHNSAPQTVLTAASTPMINPSFSHHQYSISPETCAPSPATVHNVQWTGRANFMEGDVNNSLSTWFPQPYDNFQSSAAYPFYVQNPTHPSVTGYEAMIQPFTLHNINQNMGQPIMAPDGFDLYEDWGDVKPWRRAMASHESPEAANGHARVDRQGRQRKTPIERKRKEMPNQPTADEIDQHQQIPSRYIPQAPSVVHQEMYSFPGH